MKSGKISSFAVFVCVFGRLLFIILPINESSFNRLLIRDLKIY